MYVVYAAIIGAGSAVTYGQVRVVLGLYALRKCDAKDVAPVLRAIFGKPDPPGHDDRHDELAG